MKDGLYHTDVHLPFTLSWAAMLNYSRHARNEASRDRYGALSLPRTLSTTEADVIEVEVKDGKPYKAVLRKPHDEKRDLVIVVLLDRAFVKTVWCNLRTDAHKTLDTSKYIGG
ncbi:MAG: hypothetical protein LC650_03825 [Actinobacteria bacterium]|nr:hypothetical protein [Actinomycetota bacterium]